MPSSCHSTKSMLLQIIILFLLAAACGTTKNSKEEPKEQEIMSLKNNLEQLSLLLGGRFGNKEQHEADPENYHHIVMQICPIWPNRSEGKWFYIEQGLATMPDRPYRQRIYLLHRGERDTLISSVYNLPGDNKVYVGACSDSKILSDLKPSDLELREGCSVFITKKDNTYVGGTLPNTCPSNLNGAAFVSSEIQLSYSDFLTWDRGFDTAGKHIWGAEKDPYHFKRR